MGIDLPRATDEKPSHRVYLSTFSIDRHEVTNARFAAFVAASGYQTEAEKCEAERADGNCNGNWASKMVPWFAVFRPN